MLTTALILLPVVAALVIAILPLPREMTAGLAFLAALMEVGLWIATAARFDFEEGGLQLGTTEEWVESLGISYSVGFYGFSLWLTGVTVVVSAAAIGYALWVGRDRPRAYHALMLFLTGAVVATFAAQDLLLFYVSFEAMLIPLYVLVGVWGGARRQAATLTFVVYTMAGSLLMLASVVAFGVTQDTFSLLDSGTSDNTWIFLGFAIAFAVKAPLFPFHGWLPLTYREAPPEVAAVLSAIVSKTAVYGFLVIVLAKFPEPVEDFTGVILVLAGAGLVYGSLLAFRAPDLRGIVAYSSLAQMGLIMLGLFALNDLGLDGAVLQSVAHALISAAMFLLVGMVERRCGSGELEVLGGMARGRPVLATVLLVAGMVALAVPGSVDLRRRVPDHGRGVRGGLGLRSGGRARDRARGHVRAPADLGRVARAPGERGARRGARPQARESLLSCFPLVACLIALSVWPALVSQSSFPGDRPARVISEGFR